MAIGKCRFYFDGLIVHVHTSKVDVGKFDHERSFQFENMGKMIFEADHLYPQVMKKLR